MNAVAKIELGPADRQLTAKDLGAFYTDQQVAQFLIQWAIRSANDTVMDPSFGGGVFLRSACQRLAEIGGDPSGQVFGIEIDRSVHTRIADKLSDEFAVTRPNLSHADFFDVASVPRGMVDAVVGNPPFIRYQRFNGEVRKRALAQAKKHGVQLKELCSSWAPFLIHSISMLKPGGRLAMVVPMEIGHAAYAAPVLRHLAESFREVTFLTFRKKLFPDLSEDTLLLLAEDKGTHKARFLLQYLAHSGLLEAMRRDESLVLSTEMNEKALSAGKERLIEYLLPKKTRELYRQLMESDHVVRLGGLADVGIGYVTGANDFFHLSPDAVRLWDIPEEFLLPAVRRGRSIVGLRFDRNDWLLSLDTGEAGYLLHILPNTELPDTVRKYVTAGEQQGIAKAYKCRTREPWFAVPHVRKPDAFLSYMSGDKPHLAANDAGVVAPNSLHLVKMHDQATCSSYELAALWRTSLTQLSAEIEGHPLGGGMLKLEPTEAEKIAVARPAKDETISRETVDKLDGLVRAGRETEARQFADGMFLEAGVGLDKKDCRLLEEAAELLRDRRYHREYAP